MGWIYSLLCRIFLALGLAGLIIGVIAKITGFVVWGLFPLSYLRFSGICLLFVIAISLYQVAVRK
ncbi:MAG: hypothetical protein DRG50_06830 [Deltaproteobacteria bacterium]|nr:MAG: hypothetical protein DRG50_06830 [Deltaproteobacteria bacterium]